MYIWWRLEWLQFLSRDVRMCNRRCLHSSMIGILCTIVLSWSGFGFGGLDWEPLDCWTTSPSDRWATSEPNSFIQSCFKEIFGGGREDASASRIWLFQFPSEQLSEYNKLGVFREEWWRSIVFDRTSIISSEQIWCHSCFDVSSILFCLYQARRETSRVYYIWIFMFLVHWIHRREEYRLSCAQILS